ncbi:DUF4870 family protein [Brevundimonas sp.]|uniref:DUF4870 family protein n=1 Tax=Brevundimonas sp. TaxID=1871086 RepID=UPI0035ADD2A7
MAEPGDPRSPDDDDALIGFASAESLQGRPREPEPAEPETVDAPPPEPQDEPRDEPPASRPHPIRASSIFEPSPGFEIHHRRPEPSAEPVIGGLNLYAIYALILFAVPTLGVSALIGLVAVTGRPGPDGPEARTHFIYQQRTLWAAAVAGVIGVILLAAPFALGVPLLFALALWTVIRGAAGVWTLKSGRPISDPNSWWI